MNPILNQPYFHSYNRGANRGLIFREPSDYVRMIKTIYLANSVRPFNFKNLGNIDVFSVDRKETVVNIVAYCLMPNHIHIAYTPLNPRSTASGSGSKNFVHKLMTSYTKYFNLKYDHLGTIWQGSCKQKPVLDEKYLADLTEYIHLNPYGIKEPDLTRETRVEHRTEAIKYSSEYEYSSFKDYIIEKNGGKRRPQSSILTYPLLLEAVLREE